jgi:hypothetical protein
MISIPSLWVMKFGNVKSGYSLRKLQILPARKSLQVLISLERFKIWIEDGIIEIGYHPFNQSSISKSRVKWTQKAEWLPDIITRAYCTLMKSLPLGRSRCLHRMNIIGERIPSTPDCESLNLYKQVTLVPKALALKWSCPSLLKFQKHVFQESAENSVLTIASNSWEFFVDI